MAHDGVVAHDRGEGKGQGGAACKGAVVVACDGAGDPSMWVETCGSGLGAHGRGTRWGEGWAWVVGGRRLVGEAKMQWALSWTTWIAV